MLIHQGPFSFTPHLAGLRKMGKQKGNLRFPQIATCRNSKVSNKKRPFSRGHENGSNVVIKNKGAIVLWVKMAKNKVPECSPVQNGAYPESLTHSYYTRKEYEKWKNKRP